MRKPSSKYITTDLPISGSSQRSRVRVRRGADIRSQTSSRCHWRWSQDPSGVVGIVRAAQPPVRDMQRMGPVARGEVKAVVLDGPAERGRVEDADVAAGRLVISVREPPADALGPGARTLATKRPPGLSTRSISRSTPR